MKTGAIIVAEGRRSHSDSFRPMRKVGTISAIKRLIRTFRQAGADVIVQVADEQSEELEKHISHMGVICLRHHDNKHNQMIDFAKTALSYLADKCDQVLLTPVDIPLFTADTVQRLMESGMQLASPAYNGRPGHPLLIANKLIPHFLQYRGENGLRGAIHNCNCKRVLMEVADQGTIFDTDTDENYQSLLVQHNRKILQPEVRIRLVMEEIFFGPGAEQLLLLIEGTESVRLACRQMGISYSKGWKIINAMEEQLGYQVVRRQQGGKNGGNAYLTEEGRKFLERYSRFEKECKEMVQKVFEAFFFNEADSE